MYVPKISELFQFSPLSWQQALAATGIGLGSMILFDIFRLKVLTRKHVVKSIA